MLLKMLGVLVIVTLLCGMVPPFQQEASADPCYEAQNACDQAKIYAYGICLAALTFPPAEAACIAALGVAAGLCTYAAIICGGG